MSFKLFTEAIVKFISGILIVALLLFVPAGAINYWNAWLFLGLLFIPMFIAGCVMLLKNPELLKLRLNAKEKEGEQKQVVIISAIMFLLGFISAGLNFKYNWIVMPKVFVILGSIIFLLAYIIYAEVLRENSSLARTIEVKENQKLVTTGLYSIVRHPMYLATLFLFLAMPLILGSLITFIIFLVYPLVIVKRIKNEEVVLEKRLKGYLEYKKKVKYKMIPFIW